MTISSEGDQVGAPGPTPGGASDLRPVVPIGLLIRQRRRSLGWSQRDLAFRVCDRAGHPTITRHEISRYERGRRIPVTALLRALIAVLRLPPATARQAVLSARRQRSQHPAAAGRPATRDGKGRGWPPASIRTLRDWGAARHRYAPWPHDTLPDP